MKDICSVKAISNFESVPQGRTQYNDPQSSPKGVGEYGGVCNIKATFFNASIYGIFLQESSEPKKNAAQNWFLFFFS